MAAEGQRQEGQADGVLPIVNDQCCDLFYMPETSQPCALLEMERRQEWWLMSGSRQP